MTQPDKPAPSPAFTIHMAEGVSDVIAACQLEVGRAVMAIDTAKDYDELRHLQREAVNALNNLNTNLAALLRSTKHDGDVHIYKALFGNPLSLEYTFASGFCGGMIFQPGSDDKVGRWGRHS